MPWMSGLLLLSAVTHRGPKSWSIRSHRSAVKLACVVSTCMPIVASSWGASAAARPWLFASFVFHGSPRPLMYPDSVCVC